MLLTQTERIKAVLLGQHLEDRLDVKPAGDHHQVLQRDWQPEGSLKARRGVQGQSACLVLPELEIVHQLAEGGQQRAVAVPAGLRELLLGLAKVVLQPDRSLEGIHARPVRGHEDGDARPLPPAAEGGDIFDAHDVHVQGSPVSV